MSKFGFHVLNVGQGSANVVVTPENRCLLADIEGTSLGKHESSPVHEYITGYLSYINGGSAFEEVHLVASHHDKDHIGNHQLIPELDIDKVWWPKSIDVTDPVGRNTVASTIEKISDSDSLKLSADYNDTIDLSRSVSLEFVSPPPAPLKNVSKGKPSRISRNDNSLCLLVDYQGLKVLYPGDVENHGVDWIAQSASTHDIDCLVAPHHGSATGNYTKLLNHCQPDLVIISSAHSYQNGQYDHPNKDFLKALDQRDIETYWTAVHGNVKFGENSRSPYIKTQARYSTAPLDLHSSAVDQKDLCQFDPVL